MDPDRWKSVAVPISVWEMLKKLSDKEDRSIGGTIAWLTKKNLIMLTKTT